MKFGRRVQEEEQSVPLAPLIDIVFLTLVFFMTTAVYTSIEKVDIQLPTADSAEPAERTHTEIYINLREDGKIVLNDREVSLPELQATLNRLAEHSPGGAVILRGDRDALFGRAVSIIDCCRNADIQNISIAAIKEESKETS